MKVKIIATIVADINVFPDEIINSDTIGDYVSQLNCDIGNDALFYLSNYLKNTNDIIVNSAEPYGDEGIEEYSKLLENWINEYPKRLAEWQEKLKQNESS